MPRPLEHIRVLDLTRVLAGPWATQNLADLGAEVIKIERPGSGDETRTWGPPWLKDGEGRETREAAYYLSVNRGKKSVTVDLSKPAGQQLIRDLAAGSDVLVEMYASLAITAALAWRERSGVGQWIDLSLLDTIVAFTANQTLNYWCSGAVPRRHGNAHANLVPYQVFPSSDGDMVLAIGNDGQFAEFCRVAGQPELSQDPRFRTNPDRVRHRELLVPIVETIVRSRSSHEWISALAAAGVPCGPINDLQQVFEDPQVRHRGLRVEILHSAGVPCPTVASPMRFSATPVEYDTPPPLLGQHTREVLAGVLGLGDTEMDALAADGVI